MGGSSSCFCFSPPDEVGVRKQQYQVVIYGFGHIGYALVPMIASGGMFGNAEVKIVCLESEPQSVQYNLKGVKMEMEDSRYPLLKDFMYTPNAKEALTDADLAICVASCPRKQGMSKHDMLQKNLRLFRPLGEKLRMYAKSSLKVVVVGNPANSNCYILSRFASNIPAKNITALTRLDHNRLLGQVAKKLQVSVGSVQNVIVWGNHGSSQYPDISVAKVHGKTSVMECLNRLHPNALEWLSTDFLEDARRRGKEVMESRWSTTACSAARAIAEHCRDWILGTPKGEFVSMGVVSDGNPYNIAQGLTFSLPCVCKGGSFLIVDLKLPKATRDILLTNEQELLKEREMIESLLAEDLSAG